MIKVKVGWDPIGLNINVAVLRRTEGVSGGEVLCIGPAGERSWERYTPGASIKPTAVLEDEEAAALLAALASHYQGVDDQRALRQDYEAERARVDRLTEAVIGIAQRTAS